jgi:hypothetical protein
VEAEAAYFQALPLPQKNYRFRRFRITGLGGVRDPGVLSKCSGAQENMIAYKPLGWLIGTVNNVPHAINHTGSHHVPDLLDWGVTILKALILQYTSKWLYILIIIIGFRPAKNPFQTTVRGFLRIVVGWLNINCKQM